MLSANFKPKSTAVASLGFLAAELVSCTSIFLLRFVINENSI